MEKSKDYGQRPYLCLRKKRGRRGGEEKNARLGSGTSRNELVIGAKR